MKFWLDMFLARNIEPKLTRQLGTMLSEKGLVNVTNKKYSVPMGNWAGTVSYFYLYICIHRVVLYLQILTYIHVSQLGEIRGESFKTWLRITADFSFQALGYKTKEEYLEQIDGLEAEFAEIKPHGDHYVVYGQKPIN